MKALVILGPTGVGKTEISLKIVSEYFKGKFEIISADSVQVYEYLDIGSEKISYENRAKIPHYLIDIHKPDFHFTAADFCNQALKISKDILSKGKIPLFVGGSGLYIDAFFQGLSKIPDIGGHIRSEIEKAITENGLEFLYNELVKSDPVFAKKIHKNDKQRIIRGLEVFRGTGKPISYYQNKKKGVESEKTLYLGIYKDSKSLYQIINKRVLKMIDKGLIDEVISLRKKGYHADLKSMQSIGYAQINDFLDEKISYEKAIKQIQHETRRYAKKQMTWFKRNKKIHWFENLNNGVYSQIRSYIADWLEKYDNE